MKKLLVAACVFGAVALPAAAEGLYVQGDVGQSKVSLNAGDGFTLSKPDVTYALGLGYDINPNLAVELSYRDFGSIDWHNSNTEREELSAQSAQLSALGKLPVSNLVNVYGRLGVARVKASDTFFSGNTKDDITEYRTRMMAGIGASYEIMPGIETRAEYSQYAKVEGASLSTLTLGVTYHFQ